MIKEKSQQTKWYFKTFWIVTALLSAGPLALPLVWLNPGFSRKKKVTITIITIILSWYFGSLVARSLSRLKEYYGLILQGNF